METRPLPLPEPTQLGSMVGHLGQRQVVGGGTREKVRSGVVEDFTGHHSVYCIVVLCLTVEMASWAVWIERALSNHSFIRPSLSLSIIAQHHLSLMVIQECVCQSVVARVFLRVCKVRKSRHTRAYAPVPVATACLFFTVLTRAVISFGCANLPVWREWASNNHNVALLS